MCGWDDLFHIPPCIHSTGDTCRSSTNWYCQGLLRCSCHCCCTASNHTIHFIYRRPLQTKQRLNGCRTMCLFFQDVWDDLYHIPPCIHSTGDTCRSSTSWYCQGLLWRSCLCCCAASNHTIHFIYRRPLQMKQRLNGCRTMCLFFQDVWYDLYHIPPYMQSTGDTCRSSTNSTNWYFQGLLWCSCLCCCTASNHTIHFIYRRPLHMKQRLNRCRTMCLFFQDVWDDLYHIPPCIHSTGDTCRSSTSWYSQGRGLLCCLVWLRSVFRWTFFTSHVQETFA